MEVACVWVGLNPRLALTLFHTAPVLRLACVVLNTCNGNPPDWADTDHARRLSAGTIWRSAMAQKPLFEAGQPVTSPLGVPALLATCCDHVPIPSVLTKTECAPTNKRRCPAGGLGSTAISGKKPEMPELPSPETKVAKLLVKVHVAPPLVETPNPRLP